MCNHTTDDPICDNLQSIAIAATVDPSFGEWLRDVELALRNKSAIAHRSNHVLHNCYKDGLTPSFVATRLDQTFDALQPRLFKVEQESTTFWPSPRGKGDEQVLSEAYPLPLICVHCGLPAVSFDGKAHAACAEHVGRYR